MLRTNRFVVALIAAVVACSLSGRLTAQGPAADAPQRATRITHTPQYRLKIMATYHPGLGLRVVSVEENGPATKLVKQGEPDVHGSLEPGDLITHVDGQLVESLQNFYDLVKAGGTNRGKIVLRVRDVTSGQIIHWEATPVGGQGLVPISPPPPGTRQLHVLLIGLTNDASIGKAQEKNLVGLQELLHSEIPAQRIGSLRVLKAEEVTAARILATVDATRLSPSDTLFCYYGGHGAFDPQRAAGDPSGGHHFQIPSGDLMRKTLMKHLLDKGARLTVLITDTCNVRSRANVHIPEAPGAPAPETPTALEILLLQHSGVVDISASSRGQFSWNNATVGGWFTFVACHTLTEHDCSAWNVALERLSEKSNGFYHLCREKILANPGQMDADTLQAIRDQRDMIPQAFRLNVQRD